MFKVNYSGTKKLIRSSRLLTPVLCLISLSACTSFGWGGSNINAASALAPLSSSRASTVTDSSLMAMGTTLAAQGNHNAAIPLFKSANYKSSGSVDAKIKLGKSLMAVGRYDEAIDVLLAAKNNNSTNQEVLITLGQLYLTLYKPTTAGQYFKAALPHSKRGDNKLTATAYSGLGVSLELSGNHEAAQEAFDMGLSINPNNMNLLSNKALSLAIAGKSEEAIEILLSLAQNPQAKTQHRQNLALAYVFNGESKRAWQVASIDMTPNKANQVIAGFYTLKGLEPKNRMHALVYGMAKPRTGIEKTANKRALSPDGSEAAKRIAPKVKKEVIVEKTVAQLPPLLDPTGWAVQIGAYRKPIEVIRGWEILKNKYFHIIGNLEPRRSEVNFGNRANNGPSGFYYRLNAGPLSGYKQSRDICTALIRAGGKCWIRPPEPSEGKLPK